MNAKKARGVRERRRLSLSRGGQSGRGSRQQGAASGVAALGWDMAHGHWLPVDGAQTLNGARKHQAGSAAQQLCDGDRSAVSVSSPLSVLGHSSRNTSRNSLQVSL